VAQESGADFVISDDEGLKKIQDGWTDWDVSIAMADMMGKAGRLGKVLGPRGLMPSPKAGNITQSAGDLPRMITEAKAGRVEFRVDKTAGVHVPIGKASFTHQQLMQNFAALMDALKKAKPSPRRVSTSRRFRWPPRWGLACGLIRTRRSRWKAARSFPPTDCGEGETIE